ncbi:MAG: HD domain-containing protein, partial [Chloroflexota bacterium]|nr:HD domain-containing protein [Chloroflexota bacterium]
SRSKRFENALKFAARLHAGQTRKGSNTPYIGHLLAVAAIAIEHGASEDEAIGALLHDAVEDQGGKPTLRKIRRRYGKRVARIVDGCTDTDKMPKPPWCQRKKDFVASLHTASPSIRLVVAADKLHNARAVLSDYRNDGEAVWSNFTTGRDGTLWYYRSVTDSLLGSLSSDDHQLETLISELNRIVSTLAQECGGPAPSTFCD